MPGERFGLASRAFAQADDRRHETVRDLEHRRDVHRRRERVVGRLGHVDVIVGMDGVLTPHYTAGQLDRTI